MSHICELCNIIYKSNSGLWKHNNKNHNNNLPKTDNTNEIKKFEKDYCCRKCFKPLSDRNSRWRHEKSCKNKDIFIKTNLISDLNKKIANIENSINEIQQKKIKNEDTIKVLYSIILIDNLNIYVRSTDLYIDANSMCKQYNKEFNDWYFQDFITELMCEIANKTHISVKKLIVRDKDYIWICHEIAQQLAFWLSPIFAVKTGLWLKNLDISGETLKIKDKIIHNQNEKIKYFENTTLKKQRRNLYPEQNVIYILTTEFYKPHNTYIIGKAQNLENRLGVYNKTCEHEVVYYKSCGNDEVLNIVESIVLAKLTKYKEKANRDRFILPTGASISLFISEINNAIDYFKNTGTNHSLEL